jgi:hypothetical protein
MTAASLLTILRDRGLTVEADGDALTVRPRDLLTDELRAAIRANKRELLDELPRYRWLVIGASGPAKEVCCLPEMTAAEMQACYPGAHVMALPDVVTEDNGTLLATEIREAVRHEIKQLRGGSNG